MQAFKSLSDLDIAGLWKSYKDKNDLNARNALIENYLSLVNTVVGHIACNLPAHVDRDDLISSGFFGLMDAVSRFDTTLGIKFETYAKSRIRGTILDYLRSKDWLSVSLRKKIKEYENIYTQLEVKLERTPTKEELAAALSMNLTDLYNLERNMNMASMTSLEDYINMEYAQPNSESVDKRLNHDFVKEKLAEAVNSLPEKEKLVISLYYVQEMTLKEIGRTLNLSEARISQLHKRAVLRLRGYLAKSKADFF